MTQPNLTGTLEAVIDLSAFLAHFERSNPGAMWGGYRVDEAIEALAHIARLTPAAIRGIGLVGGEDK